MEFHTLSLQSQFNKDLLSLFPLLSSNVQHHVTIPVSFGRFIITILKNWSDSVRKNGFQLSWAMKIEWEIFCLESLLEGSFGSKVSRISGLFLIREFSFSSFSMINLLKPKKKCGVNSIQVGLNLAFWQRKVQVEENYSWKA